MKRDKWPILALVILIVVVALQIFPFAAAQSRTLYGFVFSAATGQPLAATITVSRCFNQQIAATGLDGSWEILYPYGTLGTITFSAPGYATQSFQLDMNAQWYDSGGIVSLQPTT